MKAVVIGAAGHIGTYLTPMLVKGGFETVAITRSMSKPYEDDPAWSSAERVLLDRDNDPDFIEKLKAMQPDIIVDLVNFNVAETKKIVEAFKNSSLSHYLYCSSCWAHGMAETVPFDPDALRKEPLDDYGKDKFASEMYLKEQYRQNGFPATIIMPGQISGAGWTIINPWGNTSMRVFQDIADGKEICLPNFGQEILHHVHGYDVAQVFYQAITHRNQALGESFDAEAATHTGLTCHSRTVLEDMIGIATVEAINKLIGQKDGFLTILKENIETVISETGNNVVSEIDKKLEELQKDLLRLANSKEDYNDIADEIYRLREERHKALAEEAGKKGSKQRLEDMEKFLNEQSTLLEEYDEQLVRRLIEKITVYDDKLTNKHT